MSATKPHAEGGLTLEQQAIEHLLSATHELLKLCAEIHPTAEAQLNTVYDHLCEVNNRLDVMKHRAAEAYPKCGSTETDRHHHHATALAPECHYMACEKCGHQWGHE